MDPIISQDASEINFMSGKSLDDIQASPLTLFLLQSAILGAFVVVLVDLSFDVFRVGDLMYKFHRFDEQKEVSLDGRLHNMKYNCPEVMGSEFIRAEFGPKTRMVDKIMMSVALDAIDVFCVSSNALVEMAYKVMRKSRVDDSLPPHPRDAYSYSPPPRWYNY